jgi:hypothetical protein
MAKTRIARTQGAGPGAARAVRAPRAAGLAQLQAAADRGAGARLAALQRLADAGRAPAQR